MAVGTLLTWLLLVPEKMEDGLSNSFHYIDHLFVTTVVDDDDHLHKRRRDFEANLNFFQKVLFTRNVVQKYNILICKILSHLKRRW